jgi:hypothetical protein
MHIRRIPSQVTDGKSSRPKSSANITRTITASRRAPFVSITFMGRWAPTTVDARNRPLRFAARLHSQMMATKSKCGVMASRHALTCTLTIALKVCCD